MKNTSDVFRDKLDEISEGIAPDYIAPVLTIRLIKVARSIGLELDTVISELTRFWRWSEELEGSSK